MFIVIDSCMHITSEEMRKKYLDFFASKDHHIIPSASLVPENDPSVLFNTAGMQPLVPYLLGETHPLGTRLADSQKCVRTNDLEDVGDNTHCTFFEMLGNWSLGDYFKSESIAWSYEFLTDPKWLGIDPSRLAVTVFEGNEDAPRDDESFAIWRSIGIPAERISPLPAEDNWWAAGPTGPCGPDTEIFYWVGAGEPPADSNVGNDPKNWMEIWNNVFMQFNRLPDGSLVALPKQNVDTGMGLERILVTLNGYKSIYDTDFHAPVMTQVRSLAGDTYNERGARIIADHTRATVHMLSEGVLPSNVDAGYVLRRLIRRAVRETYKMSINIDILLFAARHYIEKYASVYTLVDAHRESILEELQKEIDRFKKTLEKGIQEFEKHVQKSGTLSGKDVFDLFQTYGFPYEMTIEMMREQNLAISLDTIIQEYESEFKKHQDLSRIGAEKKFAGGLADTSDATVAFHTVTHLLLAGLRSVYGPDIHQAGANITAERIRFDFNHAEKMTSEEIAQVERFVNAALTSPSTVTLQELPKDEARSQGVYGTFWERYPDVVKVYTVVGIDGTLYSQEVCGGPHVETTAGLGVFKIVKEESSSAGVRRIKAILQ